ncbi:tail fiber protein [Flavobacteriaceae bacterium]|nr:tail fiber protein [Flavobacteriaceae bacterium]MDC0098496.1 tail fiber protein [Flavobacteriaceae bacterium]
MKTSTLSLVLLIVSLSCGAQNSLTSITQKNGMIGIGTNTPDQKLTVKGKIHTQEVLVDLNGAVAPDYVFEMYYKGYSALKGDYRMLDLKSLEAFLKENHHLPEIPSAQKLKEDGLELKKMNLLLLQKIEELTLYTLQQQKQLDALQGQVQLLTKQE